MEDSDILENFLPVGYKYKIISKNEIESVYSCEVNFNLVVRVNVSSIDEVQVFLKNLDISSSCTFNVKQGRPDKEPIDERQDPS